MKLGLWINGLRLRTLPASIAPVLLGAAAAWSVFTRYDGWGMWCHDERNLMGLETGSGPCAAAWYAEPGALPRFIGVTALCLGVALFLQIAVNFANDYSDGIRGTDAGRGSEESSTSKPQRLTASGLVNPRSVLLAAGIAALLACLCGLALVVITRQYWFIVVGLVCVIAGWYYTGGEHPYGYAGLGELFVFVFFGLVATLGTQFSISMAFDGFGTPSVRAFDFTSIGSGIGENIGDGSPWSSAWFFQGEYGIDALGIGLAVISGLYSVAILMVNNLRDIDEDRVSGKRTLAVRLGGRGAHIALIACIALILLLSSAAFLHAWTPWGLVLWLIPAALGIVEIRTVSSGDFRKALAGASRQLVCFALLIAISVVAAGANC